MSSTIENCPDSRVDLDGTIKVSVILDVVDVLSAKTRNDIDKTKEKRNRKMTYRLRRCYKNFFGIYILILWMSAHNTFIYSVLVSFGLGPPNKAIALFLGLGTFAVVNYLAFLKFVFMAVTPIALEYIHRFYFTLLDCSGLTDQNKQIANWLGIALGISAVIYIAGWVWSVLSMLACVFMVAAVLYCFDHFDA